MEEAPKLKEVARQAVDGDRAGLWPDLRHRSGDGRFLEEALKERSRGTLVC